jgi:hypothetical protein
MREWQALAIGADAAFVAERIVDESDRLRMPATITDCRAAHCCSRATVLTAASAGSNDRFQRRIQRVDATH